MATGWKFLKDFDASACDIPLGSIPLLLGMNFDRDHAIYLTGISNLIFLGVNYG
jgi:hypothetical protein